MLLTVDGAPDTEESPTLAVIEAVAEREDVAPTELEPPRYESLYNVCNPEALDALFAPREDGTPRGSGQISFQFCGYDVTVESDGEVTVTDPAEETTQADR